MSITQINYFALSPFSDIAQTEYSLDNTTFQAHFNLTTEEQGENFGQHGFTGDIKLEFEIAQPDENEEVNWL